MEDLGNKYALAALKKRRAETAGEIADLKKQLAWRQSQLDHLDATLLIFDPEIDPRALPVSRPRKRVKLFRQGELGRLILDALREAGSPQGAHEIVSALLRRSGMGEAVRPALTPRIRGNLAYLEGRGAVAKKGSGRLAMWHIPG
jgi:hypothetical protein